MKLSGISSALTRFRTTPVKTRAFLLSALKYLWNEIEFRDVLVFGGLGIASVGIARIYPPAGWILCGMGLFVVGYFGLPEDWIKLKILAKKHDAK